MWTTRLRVACHRVDRSTHVVSAPSRGAEHFQLKSLRTRSVANRQIDQGLWFDRLTANVGWPEIASQGGKRRLRLPFELTRRLWRRTLLENRSDALDRSCARARVGGVAGDQLFQQLSDAIAVNRRNVERGVEQGVGRDSSKEPLDPELPQRHPEPLDRLARRSRSPTEKRCQHRDLLPSPLDRALCFPQLRCRSERDGLSTLHAKRAHRTLSTQRREDQLLLCEKKVGAIQPGQGMAGDSIGSELQLQREREADLEDAPQADLANPFGRATRTCAEVLKTEREIVAHHFCAAAAHRRIAQFSGFRNQDAVGEVAQLLLALIPFVVGKTAKSRTQVIRARRRKLLTCNDRLGCGGPRFDECKDGRRLLEGWKTQVAEARLAELIGGLLDLARKLPPNRFKQAARMEGIFGDEPGDERAHRRQLGAFDRELDKILPVRRLNGHSFGLEIGLRFAIVHRGST